MVNKPALLLHICCGVCAGYPLEKLLVLGYKVTGFFFNPNIFPEDEYTKRLDAARKICHASGVELIVGGYDHSSWLKACCGLEREAEGGARCKVCFESRLYAAYQFAMDKGFDYFSTTLTVSPYKNSDTIFRIAQNIAGDKFLAMDFKQDDGFRKTIFLAKELDIYRQRYCGCEYSLPPL